MKGPVELWVDALRSGEYKQGQSYLQAGDEYCCLGVACALYQEHVGGLKVANEEDGVVTFDNRADLPPEPVVNWLGLANDKGAYYGSMRSSLVAANDKGASFSEIADLIESRPEGLFVDAS